MVVDDDEAIGPAVQALLEPERISVEAPGGGAAALPSLLRDPPDLIILDVNMPGMSGWEMCAILRRQSATRDIPILFLTGRHEVKDRITAMQFGGSDYLCKPFTTGELLGKVRALLPARSGAAR